MLHQKLKSGCKLLSFGLGLVSSYVTYQYQQTVGIRMDASFSENVTQLQQWIQWKSKVALHRTEDYLMQYCHWLSLSPWFHQMDMTSCVIYLANSQKLTLHQFGVKLLAVIQFPKNVDMKYYIEKCDTTALVGLARSEGINSKWFPHDEALHLNQVHGEEFINMQSRIGEVLREVEMITSSSNMDDSCALWMYRRIAHQKLPEDPVTNMMADLCTERDNSELSSRTEIPFRKNVLTYLEILSRFSNNDVVTGHRVISLRILDTVKELIMRFDEQGDILLVCGNILANLAVNEVNRKAIVQNKFLPLLMQWKNSGNLSLEVVSDRVLYNLDVCENSSPVLHNGIYILHPGYRPGDENAIVDVVFIHGINGSPFYTWRQNDACSKVGHTGCWPKDWLPFDHRNIRVISVQYESFLSDWYLSCPTEKVKYSLDVQANNIKKKLEDCGIGKRPVIWVAHSMGGLIIKKVLLLCENSFTADVDSNILSSTKSIVFYSVPHLGSPIATKSEKVKFLLFPSIQVNELSENSAKLQQIHYQFSRLLETYHIDCINFGESRPLSLPYVKLKYMVVPRTSCDVGYGRFILLDANHRDVCKPVSKTDPRYLEVSALVANTIDNETTNIAS